MTSKYIGITIGPIFDTISEAISPASMWFASTFFSQITYNLCREIEAKGGYIFSPYFDKKTDLSDGVGKYHDRILLTSDQLTKSHLDQMITQVVEDMATDFQPAGESAEQENQKKNVQAFLKEYLQINYVILEEEDVHDSNVCDLLNGYLDRLELMPTFPASNQNNPFRRLFLGKERNRNLYIKQSQLFDSVRQKDRFLNADGHIKDLSEIAYQGLKLKSDDYFAVVNSDGDNIGNLLKRLCKDEKGKVLPAQEQVERVLLFSKSLLSYAQKAAKLIHDADGMTIYAGGDDLLFLAPVQRANGGTILALCQALKDLFDTEIVKNAELEKYIDPTKQPSLSFGVSIQYNSFPLYEALEKSRNLLYEAKQFTYRGQKDAVKSALALKLIKHSGQEISMAFHTSKIAELQDLLVFRPQGTDTVNNLHSVIYTLSKLDTTFAELSKWHLAEKPRVDNFFKRFSNFFDNAGQEQFKAYLERLSQFYYGQFLEDNLGKIQLLGFSSADPDCEEESTDEDQVTLPTVEAVVASQLLTFQQILRLKKFFIEKGGKS